MAPQPPTGPRLGVDVPSARRTGRLSAGEPMQRLLGDCARRAWGLFRLEGLASCAAATGDSVTSTGGLAVGAASSLAAPRSALPGRGDVDWDGNAARGRAVFTWTGVAHIPGDAPASGRCPNRTRCSSHLRTCDRHRRGRSTRRTRARLDLLLGESDVHVAVVISIRSTTPAGSRTLWPKIHGPVSTTK